MARTFYGSLLRRFHLRMLGGGLVLTLASIGCQQGGTGNAVSPSHQQVVPGTAAAPLVGARNPAQKAPPRMAILVDDIGYRKDRLTRLLALPIALSFAVIPGTPHDQASAAMIVGRGRDLLVHMPMEPEGYPRVNPGPCALLTSMSSRELTAILDRCAGRLPKAIGMNNHMGSAFTTSLSRMSRVATWLKSHGMFFVDSLTIPDTVGGKAMAAVGVPWIQRDIFADNDRNVDAINRQLEKAKKMALRKGKVLLLCHPHEVTIKVLATWVAEHKFAPVTIVPLRDLIT